MHDDLQFGPVTQTEEVDRLGDVLSHAFGFPEADAETWFARAGLQNIRVLKRGAHLLGGLIEIPMGQFFGGRSVSMLGVAGVGVAPAERGSGVGTHLMVSMLREARARSFALSTLYPATVTLYRRAGYERAGALFTVSLDPRSMEIARVPDMTIGEVSGAPADVMALYAATASRSSGYIDRGPYVWERVTQPRGLVTKTFTVSHGGKLEGYVVLAHVMPAGDGTTVTVTDLAATTSRAASAILRFLVEYRSLATTVKWKGGTSDVFTNLLPERHASTVLTDYFMVRVVDVERALVMRGWPRCAAGSLILDVKDASLPENSGCYSLTVEDGRAQVTREPGAKRGARVEITERGLAALYTGHAPTHVLAAAGWLDADEARCALLDSWFAGPHPAMRDFF